MMLGRTVACLAVCVGCGATQPPTRSACSVALDRGTGFYLNPLKLSLRRGTTVQLQAFGPPECLPATFYVDLADAANLNISPDGLVRALAYGQAYARARATDT